MLVNCEFCGHEFTTYPSRLKDGKGKFCSVSCYAQWQSENKCGENNTHWQGGKESRVCEICGIVFAVDPSVVSKGSGRFCSNACVGKWRSQHLRKSNNPRWQGGMVTTTCQQCGKEFETHPCRIRSGRDKFCGRVCEGKWRSEHITGENHHNWRGGRLPYTPDWTPALRRYIRKRDNHICAICGKSAKSVHHIDYCKSNHACENLITLCRSCHGKTNVHRHFYTTILTPIARRAEAA